MVPYRIKLVFEILIYLWHVITVLPNTVLKDPTNACQISRHVNLRVKKSENWNPVALRCLYTTFHISAQTEERSDHNSADRNVLSCLEHEKINFWCWRLEQTHSQLSKIQICLCQISQVLNAIGWGIFEPLQPVNYECSLNAVRMRIKWRLPTRDNGVCKFHSCDERNGLHSICLSIPFIYYEYQLFRSDNRAQKSIHRTTERHHLENRSDKFDRFADWVARRTWPIVMLIRSTVGSVSPIAESTVEETPIRTYRVLCIVIRQPRPPQKVISERTKPLSQDALILGDGGQNNWW